MNNAYAVYVRVSTDHEEQVSSIENQIDICRNWLERNGFEWNENNIYKDEGISGSTFLDRPAIQLILEKARKKEIDMIIFKSISRLARDLKDSLEIREVLIAHNVRIISIEEGYDSHKAGKNDMAFEFFSLFSAQYSRTLSAGITAALAAKVRRGEHIGKTPYGYDKVNKKLVINEEESQVIKQIFDWYINEGWGFKRITNELNARGIRPQMSAVWQVTSVQRIIRNPIYCGDFILNQYTYVKVDGRRKQIRNPREKWILFRDHHPAIITREEWEKANSKEFKKTKRKAAPHNELRGIAKCSECGSNMVVMPTWKRLADGNMKYWFYMKCSLRRRAGAAGCVNHDPSITYPALREMIIKQLIEKGEKINFNFSTNLEGRKKKELEEAQKRLEQMEQRKKNLLDLYLDRLIGKKEFEEKRKEIEDEAKKLEAKILELQQKKYTDTKIRSIHKAFSELKDREQDLHRVFKTLIDEIIVHPFGGLEIKYSFD